MPRTGSGSYQLPPSNPVAPGTEIDSGWANDTMSDLGSALSQSIAYDGQTTPIANLQMGGFHHTNTSDPTARNQYSTLSMVQDGKHQRVQITAGVDNLIGTLVGNGIAYVAGAIVSFYAPATNTGGMTLNYNGIGARTIVNALGEALSAGDVVVGTFLMAIYTGTAFQLISATRSSAPSELIALRTSGQERPITGSFIDMTIATGSTVNVPAGTAWVSPAGNPVSARTEDAIKVTWSSQTITLTYLTASFSTTIAVNSAGQIIQVPGRAFGDVLRTSAVLGVVTHLTGVATSIITRPMIFGDDNYRAVDTTSLLANVLISGGLVTGNAIQLLQMDISAGSIFSPGSEPNQIDSPNVLEIPQQNNLQFRTLAGQNTVGGALVQAVPVTQYDPNGLGTVTTIPNNADTVIHRLYTLYGTYIFVFGQYIYSSVENALSFLEVDRTRYKPSLYLADATLLAEIISIKNATSLLNIAQAAIVAPGGVNFSIGSPGGIAEAPVDGNAYGRLNAAWAQVLAATSPLILTDATITGSNPQIKTVLSPVAPGTAGLDVKSGAFDWFGVEVTNPDDKAYFRSYNPASGLLRFTTEYNLATGAWAFPQNVSVNGLATVNSMVVSTTLGVTGNTTMQGTLNVTGAITGTVSTATNALSLGGALKVRYPTSTTDNLKFVISATAPPGGTPNDTITFVTV